MLKVKITILMPCLNEAETLETCILKAKEFLRRSTHQGEILIADNGSSDGSQEIAKKNGVRLVNVKNKGYGSALTQGIKEAKGEWIVMGDADDSYDFTELDAFIEKFSEGYDLVMGNRFKGGIKKGAMPKLHRYIGNPVLSGIGKLLFKSEVSDFHSGLRGFKRQSIIDLNLVTTGMEYASEMVVKATLNKLKITEVPVVLYPDGRSRPPHLRSWRDGWRHLTFLLLYSPKWLFYYPGIILMVIGLVFLLLISTGILDFTRVKFEINSMLFLATIILLGFNIATLGLYTNIYAIISGLVPPDERILRIVKSKSLEIGIVIGLLLLLLGSIGFLITLKNWVSNEFGELDSFLTIRTVIPSFIAMTIGTQIIFSSFFINVLKLNTKKSKILT